MKGARRDRYGIRAYVKVGRRQREKRFPFDTAAEKIKKWRDETRSLLRKTEPVTPRKTVRKDVARYLAKETIRALAEYGARGSHLDAWIDLYGDLPRESVDEQKVLEARDAWLKAGYAPKTINHRVRIWQHLCRELDGRSVPTPCDDIPKLRTPAVLPKFIAPARIRRVATGLKRWPFEQAVFFVLTSTGQRPAQLKRTQIRKDRQDVDLRRRVWWVRPAKGGNPIPVFLNEDMLAAWKRLLLVAAPRIAKWQAEQAEYEAGKRATAPRPALWFDTSDYDKRLYAAGWPRDVPPYNAKHSVGLALAEAGADWEDIRDFFGHKDSTTTRIYTDLVSKRLKMASMKLEGRLGWKRLSTPRARKPG